jgi:YD repeat-containing protein
MNKTRLAAALGLLILGQEAYGACTLRFTSPASGATVRSPSITVYGQGGADASEGDSGTVTARLNGASFFNYSGSFTAAVSFLQSRGVGVTLRPGLNFLSVSGSAGGCSASDSMTIMYSPDVDLSKNKGDPGDNLSCDAPSSSQGNPVDVSIGNKYQEEADFIGGGSFPLRFERIYNSLDGYWRHNYSTRLLVTTGTITLVAKDGRESRFTVSNGIATAETSELGVLTQNGAGWIYLSPSQERFSFDNLGRLVEWSNALGQSHQLAYTATAVTVTDSSSNVLEFTQDNRGQPLSLSVAGISAGYSYDNISRLMRLSKVQGGIEEEKIFHYEDPTYPHFLTGITDERGIRYATWRYDNQGRAITSEHAGGADKVIVDYNADGSSTVTNELGKKATYRFQTINGIKHISAIEGEASANCPNSNSTFTYDTRGLLKTKTDNKGHLTTYDYNERGLEVSRTEASGTPQARTIITDWHPEFFLPVTVTESDRITTYSYDTQGRQRSQSVTER